MSRFLTPWIIIGIFIALLSGCMGSDGGGPKKTDTASATVDAGGGEGGDGTGKIRGLVTDDERQPLADVQVAILKPRVSVRTDASGAYAFLNLPPGDYVVAANRLGYDDAIANVKLADGETKWHNFTLAPLAVADEPYPQYSTHKAKLQCMLKTAAWVSSCSYPYTAVYLSAKDHGVNLSSYGVPADIMDNKWRYNFSVEHGAKSIVSEMTWKAQSSMANTLWLRLCTPEYDPVADDCLKQYASVAGANPLVTTWSVPKDMVPKTAKRAWVMSAVWPTGSDPTNPTDTGVFLDQTVEMFNTVWYNGEPPENWSITKPPTK